MKYNSKAFAKLNLYLQVFKLNKGEDLHSISSLFQEISLHDILTIKVTKTQNINYKITYSGFTVPTNTNNIIGKIFETLKPQLNHSYDIHIDKKIPLGSGMGGASSNGAMFIKAINTIEQKNWDYKTLIDISKRFGSDIAFFLNGGTQEISGFGNILTPKPASIQRFFVIIYPNIECSTKKIYQHFDTMIKEKADEINESNNSLLPVVLDYSKEMKTIFHILTSEISYNVQLTGSGSTFFIETPSKKESALLKQKLSTLFPAYYIQTTESIHKDHPLRQ